MTATDEDADSKERAASVAPSEKRRLSESEVDLADCIRRIARDRDQDAFAKLFECAAPSVKKFMMSKGADSATAEELAQDAFAQVWRKAGTYDFEHGNPTAWIFAIARNLRIDRIRKERVWQFSQELPEGLEERASPEPSAEERLTENVRSAKVRAALSHLPPDQLEVIVLSFVDGLSHGEIAKRLELPLGTIKSRMRLAYDKLRPVLSDLALTLRSDA